MKQKLLVEIELDVEERRPGSYGIPCLKEPGFIATLRSGDDEVIDVTETGIHIHSYCICSKLLNWKVVSRSEIAEEVKA